MATKIAAAVRPGPAKGYVRVKMLPKDPLLARREDLWPVEVDIEAATVGDGPSSARVCVVDYNADLDTLFAPVRVLKGNSGFYGMTGIGANEASLEDFHFHQVNVWAIIEQTLGWLEHGKALARPIPWASGLGRLLVIPHAGYAKNAFYDRATGALHFFYFEGPDGQPVYTCMSRDIVTHELGHAVLDGLKPAYNEVSSAETAGFHEYFGDAVAMTASLKTREIALKLTKGAPAVLQARNIVSAIASEFGAAVHGLADHDYLRGAWQLRTMKQLTGNFEEHDLSEVLTGVYYELLQYLYVKNLKAVLDRAERKKGEQTQQNCMAAVFRAAEQTSNVMLRALDYCPPVDLRFDEYARALLRADEVAYPSDTYGVRALLTKSLLRRGIVPTPEQPAFNKQVVHELRNAPEIDEITATPADAYRFVDRYRGLLAIPHEANLRVASVYSTHKQSSGGYRPPRERIIEFTWSEDVDLKGKKYGALSGSSVELHCGGTLVFDSNRNFLHASLVSATSKRRKQLLEYMVYQVAEGNIGVADGLNGIGAPGATSYRIAATVVDGRVRLSRNAAMRHFTSKEHRH